MRKFISCLLIIPAALPAFGQAATTAPAKTLSLLPADINVILVVIAALMLVPIWSMSNTFLLAARQYYRERAKHGGLRILLPLLLVLPASSLLAQGTQVANPGFNSQSMSLFLVCLIAIEFAVIFFFAVRTQDFLRKLAGLGEPEAPPKPNLVNWLREKWSEMNFRPMEEEHALDTGHSYDGIRELDNPIPTWFTTAFLLTILFSAVYLYRYHVARTAPLQLEELKIAMAKADAEHEAYLATAASSIDENNVAVMTGGDLEAGKKVFTTLCAACHKADGGGLVGPNLTDDYWLHGGRLQDIFKTVKYGVPAKGMISWKEQLTPQQMAQVSNYILTLGGTRPPDAKEPQGTLFTADGATAPPDSTTAAAAKDTTAVK